MGLRGPPPEPTAKLRSRGSRLPKQRTAEPEFPPGTPDRPERLEGEALAYWNRHTPGLVGVGVLTPEDGDAFARLCELHGRYVALAAQVADDETLHKQWSDVVDKLLRLEAHFGLTPSSRTRIEVKPKTAANVTEDYLKIAKADRA